MRWLSALSSETPRIFLTLRTLQNPGKSAEDTQNTKEFRSKKNTKETKHQGKEGQGLVRSEKLHNKSSPNFLNFRPEFCSEFSPNFLRSSRASFRGKQRAEKITKNLRHFSMLNSQANSKKNSTKFLFRAGRVTNRYRSQSRKKP